MNIFGLNISLGRKSAAADSISIDQVIRRLEALYLTASGIQVTPENCVQSPTVKAIVTAVERRFGAMPVHVYLKTQSNGRTKKELQPSHPVEALLSKPNGWQTNVNFWMDAASALMRYGNVYSYKARGQTGPIRRLIPLHSGSTRPKQDDRDVSIVTYETRFKNGSVQEYDLDEVMHARTSSRNYLEGDSWINDVRESIALEIAAEQFGAAFLGNGAMPGITLEHMEGSLGFKKDEDATAFMQDFQDKFAKRGRFKAFLLPKGIKFGTPIPIENDKAQFLQLRQLQRTIIAGAAGVPPHMVGDLSKGTYNNVEAQGGEFTTNVIVPLVRVFEAAMERSLLTPADRAGGVIIRFNVDAILRGDFKTRQEGLQIQRNAGAINANEWREQEGYNPRPDEGGEAYYEQGPSGQQPSNGGGKKPTQDDEGDDDAAAA